MISIILENSSGSQPSQTELGQWASNAGMETIPVLQNRTSSDYEPWISFESDWYIPTIVHIGPDMTVLSMDQNVSDPGQFL